MREFAARWLSGQLRVVRFYGLPRFNETILPPLRRRSHRFRQRATAVLGLAPKAFEKRHGLGRFWQKLASTPDFYFGVPLMKDAMELFEGVRHLHPAILTGLPRGELGGRLESPMAALHFPGTRIGTTMARDHAKDGDGLVDDQTRHHDRWEDAGGIFVEHCSTHRTLRELATYFPMRGRITDSVHALPKRLTRPPGPRGRARADRSGADSGLAGLGCVPA